MPQFVSAADVRGYMGTSANLNAWSDASIGSNIIAASSFLQRRTGRQWEALTETKTFTTDGRTYLTIPDLRSVSAISQAGSALTADSTYYLIPDRHSPDIFTGIQFRPFQSHYRTNGRYLSNPEWFDRNLDHTPYSGGGVYDSSPPNDLVITGDWGWVPVPPEVTQATKVLAAFYTKRPDSVLADVEITPQGNARIFSGLPLEVKEFIMDWALGERAISVG